MEPGTLDLNSEVLDTFRNMFDISLRSALINMEEKNLQTGTITGKIKIELERDVNRETGEMVTRVKLKPDVSMKLGINTKADCEEIKGLCLEFDRNGEPIVGENQITMDEYMRSRENRTA